jgi:hypothetical protein
LGLPTRRENSAAGHNGSAESSKQQSRQITPEKDDTMRADTKTISIDASLEKTVEFLANPANLPRWAVGFAKSVRKEGDRWLVTTGAGEMGVRIASDEKSGVVDFYVSPSPGVEALAASRAIPAGVGIEYVFTQFQAPGMPNNVFSKNVQAVTHKLTVLKALLEVECPL